MAENGGTSSQNTTVSDTSPAENPAEIASRYSFSNQASSSFPVNPYNVCELNMTPDILNRSFNITLKLLSPAASSGPFCRICHEGDGNEDLVSLCKCAGTLGLVHLTCIEKWLNTRQFGHDKCEICNYTFETVRAPKSIYEWYRSEQGLMTNKSSVLGDVACFSLITPLAVISVFLCLEGAKRQIIWSNSVEAGCLMAIATFLVTVYVVWNVLTVRHHVKNYFRWRSVNQTVRLIGFRRRSTNAEPPLLNLNAAVSNTPEQNTSSEPSIIGSDANNPAAVPLCGSQNGNNEASNVCSTET